MRPLLIILLIAATTSLSGCGLYGNDEFARYAERKDTIVMSAGDAKDVNAVTHMNTPWPRNVGDRYIPGNGARTVVRAAEPYREPPQSQSQQTPTAVLMTPAATPPKP